MTPHTWTDATPTTFHYTSSHLLALPLAKTTVVQYMSSKCSYTRVLIYISIEYILLPMTDLTKCQACWCGLFTAETVKDLRSLPSAEIDL